MKYSKMIYSILTLILSLSETALAQQKLNLQTFLDLVNSQSPDLVIEKAALDDSRANASGIRLPPPMVGVMTMNDAGGKNQGYEISQELPFPSKIFADKSMRNAEQLMQETNYQFKRNEIHSSAKNSYMEFWKSYEIYKLINEKKIWFQGHLQVSRAISRNDSAAQVHFLEVESNADQIENEFLSAESDLLEKKIALKLYAPNLNVDDIVPVEPSLSKFDTKFASRKNLLLELKEKEAQLSIAEYDFKKQTYFPDLYLKYRSYQGNSMTAKNDEITVGLTLPFLYFWQSHSEHQQAEYKLIRKQNEIKKNQVEYENLLLLNIKKLSVLSKQIQNLKEKILPRAQKRVTLINNQSARSMESLDSHRSIMLDYFDLKMKEISLHVEFEKIFNETEKILSTEVQHE